jgi:hypothetical protein
MHYLWVDRIAMAYLAQIEPPACFFILLPSRNIGVFRLCQQIRPCLWLKTVRHHRQKSMQSP